MKQFWQIAASFALWAFVAVCSAQDVYQFACVQNNCSIDVYCNQSVNGIQMVPFDSQDLKPSPLFSSTCNKQQTVCAREIMLYRVYEHPRDQLNVYLQPSDDLFSRCPKLQFLPINSNFTTPEQSTNMFVECDEIKLELISNSISCKGNECNKPYSWISSIGYEGRVNFAPYKFEFNGPYMPNMDKDFGSLSLSCVFPARPPKRTRCYPVKA